MIENEILNLYEITRDKIPCPFKINGIVAPNGRFVASYTYNAGKLMIKIRDSGSITYAIYVAYQEIFNRIRQAPGKVYPRVKEVLDKYLDWIEPGNVFFRPKELPYHPEAPDAITSMMLLDTSGIEVLTTSEPIKLADYIQGKALREFQINIIKDEINNPEPSFLPEEFLDPPRVTEELLEQIIGEVRANSITRFSLTHMTPTERKTLTEQIWQNLGSTLKAVPESGEENQRIISQYMTSLILAKEPLLIQGIVLLRIIVGFLVQSSKKSLDTISPTLINA